MKFLLSFIDSWQLVRRLPNLSLLLPLIFLAGFLEGIGVSALVPLASTLTGELSVNEMPPPFNIFPNILVFFGFAPTFGALLVLIAVTMLTAFLFIHLQERAMASTRYRFLEDLRNRAFHTLFISRWEHLSDLSSGDLANQLINETERGTEAIIAMMNIFAFTVHLLIFAVFAWLLSWEMFLVAAFTLILAAYTTKRLIIAVRELGKDLVEVKTGFSRQLVDFFRGSKLLKATATEAVATEQLRASNRLSCIAARRILVNQSLMRFELQVIISIAIIVILYLSVQVLVIPVSVMLVFLFIIVRLMPKFSSLQGQFHVFSTFHPALATVDNMIIAGKAAAEPNLSASSIFDRINDSICMDCLSYRYPASEKDTLTDVSIEIPARSYVAFVGRSGSGKTTLLDIAMGLIEPSAGHLRLDGRRLQDFSLESYRKKIGYVPQDSIFFTGTIRENICFGANVKDADIWRCMEIAQISDFVRSLPDQLDSHVGESGSKLSGGQRQRLSIARALIRQPAILVLDEATSSLDSESELLFQQAIEMISKDYTLIVVAHRLSTIKGADQIYVFDQGKLVQSGKFEKLDSEKGLFAELNKSQKGI